MEHSDIQQLQQEVRELRAEVRQIKLLLMVTLVLVAGVFVALFPDLLVAAVALGVLILFGFLVSPLRRTIFQSLAQKPGTDEYDS
jgi:hypothetical protein